MIQQVGHHSVRIVIGLATNKELYKQKGQHPARTTGGTPKKLPWHSQVPYGASAPSVVCSRHQFLPCSIRLSEITVFLHTLLVINLHFI